MLRRLLELGYNVLILELAEVGVGAADRAIIIGDYGNMRRYVFFVFLMKFSHWQQLPWVLLGLGHANISIARRMLCPGFATLHD